MKLEGFMIRSALHVAYREYLKWSDDVAHKDMHGMGPSNRYHYWLGITKLANFFEVHEHPTREGCVEIEGYTVAVRNKKVYLKNSPRRKKWKKFQDAGELKALIKHDRERS